MTVQQARQLPQAVKRHVGKGWELIKTGFLDQDGITHAGVVDKGDEMGSERSTSAVERKSDRLMARLATAHLNRRDRVKDNIYRRHTVMAGKTKPGRTVGIGDRPVVSISADPGNIINDKGR